MASVGGTNTRQRAGGYLPIENYGIIGNMHTCALVGMDGSIDFMCWPDFDSPSVFCRLLDKDKGGYFSVAPRPGTVCTTKQQYLPSSNLLVTRYIHEDGVVGVTDFFPRPKLTAVVSRAPHGEAQAPGVRTIKKVQEELKKWLVRRVECVRGTMALEVDLFPAFDYARATHVTRIEQEVVDAGSKLSRAASFWSDDVQLQLDVVVDNAGDDDDNTKNSPVVRLRKVQRDGMLGEGVVAELVLHEGDSVSLVLRRDDRDPGNGRHAAPHAHITPVISTAVLDAQQNDTQQFWYNWISKSKFKGKWREVVDRSLMVLKLLTYEPTGAIIAAPTFSIPEDVGGARNWDYRYSWVRDSSFTIYILLRMGFKEEADAFMTFVSERILTSRQPDGGLPIMFTIHGATDIPELALTHLEGYKGSQPVRIGNAAAFHQQFDIYGELLDAVYLNNKYGKPTTWDQWVAVRELLDYALTIRADPDAFLGVTPKDDLVKSFDEVCKLLAVALHDAGESSISGMANSQKSAGQVPSASHTLIDLVITMAPHLPRESFSALFEISSLAVIKEDDPQLQKKAYKLIPRLAESEIGKAALQERHEELQRLMLESADKVSAPARRERLAALAAFLPLVPNDSLHIIPSILSEVVISCKEHNERARTAAFELLVIMGEKMKSADGAVIDNSKVPNMADDAPSVIASIEEFFTMVSAGLAGSTPHMISASITAITRILYEFHGLLDKDALGDLVQTVDLFLTSNNREIVSSVLGFVKVCTISLPVEMVRARLQSLIPNLMRWSHEHKGHFRAKVKHILDRMVRRFGYEIVNKHCPEADRKLIANIRKTKERNKRKKKAAGEADKGSDDDSLEDAGRKISHGGHFESGFDEALYSSDSDKSNDDDDGLDAHTHRQSEGVRRGSKGGQAFIIEEDGEPLDLLDRKAMASISSTRPLKMRKPSQGKARFNSDGKLVLGEPQASYDDKDMDGMEIDQGDGEVESGINAYMAAVSGKDVAKRGFRGKLKWSNKKGQGDDDDDEMDGGDAVAIRAKLKGRGGSRSPRGSSGEGRGGGGKGGRGGNSGRGHSRSGSGHLSSGRRGLGEERKRESTGRGGRIAKPWPGRR